MSKNYKRPVYAIVLVFFIISVAFNIMLIKKISISNQFINNNVSEDFVELNNEMREMRHLLEFKDGSKEDYVKQMNVIGEKLYGSCYNTVEKISRYRLLGKPYKEFDIREFNSVILDLIEIDDSISLKVARRKLSRLDEIFTAISKIYIGEQYDLRKDSNGEMKKLQEFKLLCEDYNSIS